MRSLGFLLLALLLLPACGPPDDGVETTTTGVLPDPPGDPATTLRRRMVDTIAREYPDLDSRVLAAMREVPRHVFVPGAPPLERVYAWTDPFPIGEGQTISAPEIVALMSARLELTGKERVLEIGTGSGYQAAILGELVEEVYTIEIIPELGRRAARKLEELGYDNVHVRIGDGYQGWPEKAPFDAIIVTAAPTETPPKLLEQLARGGRMILPVGARHGTQWLTMHRKDEDGRIRTETELPVRFVPMVHEEER
jgi:protein-L-isoaspartate(D-aspartate) O-methyltransferase